MNFQETVGQIDLKKLFDQARIFEKTPDPEGLYRYLLIIFGLLFIISFYLKYLSKDKDKFEQKAYLRTATLFLFTSITGAILVLLRWQSMPYVGSRLVQLFLLVIFVFWGLDILWYKLKVIPRQKQALAKKERFEKYLPKPKRKKQT